MDLERQMRENVVDCSQGNFEEHPARSVELLENLRRSMFTFASAVFPGVTLISQKSNPHVSGSGMRENVVDCSRPVKEDFIVSPELHDPMVGTQVLMTELKDAFDKAMQGTEDLINQKTDTVETVEFASYEDFMSFDDIVATEAEPKPRTMKPTPRQAFDQPVFVYSHRLQVRRCYEGTWGWTPWQDVDVWYPDTTFKKSKKKGEAAVRRYNRMKRFVDIDTEDRVKKCEWRVVPYKMPGEE
jgi:hypothetical protein